jgi:hypothetical protein
MEREVSPPRVYVDTSVFGGVFEDEFAADSQSFFAAVRERRVSLVVSDIVLEEINQAPEHVVSHARTVLEEAEVVSNTDEIAMLAQAYITDGIVPKRYRADAVHIATATVARCRFIVSWNFKHIVNFRAIVGYNAVNRRLGYQEIAIHAPWKKVWHEEEV